MHILSQFTAAPAISTTTTDITTKPPVRALINLDHLRYNARLLQRRAGRADIMAVVKSDAYGHGAVRVARTLSDEGICHFAVARVGEGIDLRRAGIEGEILALGAPLPDRLPAYARHHIAATVASRDVATAVVETASPTRPLRVHVNVDTGMGRIGIAPEDAPAVLRQLAQAPGVHVAGLWTHFATASDPDSPFARDQLERFSSALDRSDVADDVPVHAANSSALLTLADSYRPFNPTLIRAGILLYGLADTRSLAQQAGVRPVMQLEGQVTQVKTVRAGTSISYGRTWTASTPTRVATLGAGYGDGYPRLASNRAEATLHDHRRPLVGTVCMDMCFVDCGSPDSRLARRVSTGDYAVLFGPDGPSAFDVAAWAETIPYEVCCNISERVPRTYVEA